MGPLRTTLSARLVAVVGMLMFKDARMIMSSCSDINRMYHQQARILWRGPGFLLRLPERRRLLCRVSSSSPSILLYLQALTRHRPKKCEVGTDGAATLPVRIGYYDAGAVWRDCNPVQPENLAAGVLTHINVGYEWVNSNGEITNNNTQTMARMTRLKRRYNGLRVNVILGGWGFNDPYSDDRGSIHRWSDVVSTVPNREKFINSLVRYMHRHSLDGVDIGECHPVLHTSAVP